MYSNDLICNILEFLDLNINTKLTIEQLEYKFFYNRYHIMKLFKKEIGLSIFDYINKIRIYNSIQDINNNQDKLLINIGLNNGFYSLEYFSEIFKREIGISPRQYKTIKNKRYIIKEDITKRIINIYKLKERVAKYLKNRKPQVIPVRKLSIFK